MTPQRVLIYKLRTTVLGNSSVDPLPGCMTHLIFMINTNKSKSKKGSVHFGSQFDGQSITAGESWRQECEAAHHSASAVRKPRDMNACVQLSFCFVFYLAGRVALPESIKLIQKMPHKQVQRFISRAILHPVKLTIETFTKPFIISCMCHGQSPWVMISGQQEALPGTMVPHIRVEVKKKLGYPWILSLGLQDSRRQVSGKGGTLSKLENLGIS